MLAFPAKGSTDHEGEGILTELVQLSHEFSTESLKKSEGYGGMSTGEQDRKAASDLGVSDEHIVRPRYGRGQEILVYKDAEHLHRSPRATSDPAGRAREAIWRFPIGGSPGNLFCATAPARLRSRSVPVSLSRLLASRAASTSASSRQFDAKPLFAAAAAPAQMPGLYLAPARTGAGEDLALGGRVSVGLAGSVDADVQTAIGKDDPQTFDWLAYYEVGGLMRAMANTEQFDPEPLLSGKPRVDAVQQGYFMIYNATTLADFDMKDHFFSITLDLAKHTEYEAHGVAPNCTLRFVVFESEPNVVSVKGSNIVLDGSFVGEEDAANYQDGAGAFNRVLRSTEELEQHFADVGLRDRSGDRRAARAVRKPVDQLWIGVQCVRGYATEPCTPRTTATKYDDCNTYCPYTLTARAVPRALKTATPSSRSSARGSGSSSKSTPASTTSSKSRSNATSSTRRRTRTRGRTASPAARGWRTARASSRTSLDASQTSSVSSSGFVVPTTA